MDDTILKVTDLSVTKNRHRILESVSFDVKKGETVAVIGPNGAGKTTLFKALLGIVDYEGKVSWAKNIKLGYVPQKLYIESDVPITTYEFFLLKEKDKNKIANVLESVGLTGKSPQGEDLKKHILKSRLGVLSGGELQRVLIAWALLGNPDVLLFDEPTSGVDMVGEETIYTLLDRLKDTSGMTVILISHELDVVFRHANQVVCINKERVCFGPPKIALNKMTIEKLYGEEVGYYHHEHKN